MIEQQIQLQIQLEETLRGCRLDQALAQLLPDYSRSRLQAWILQGFVTVQGQVAKSRYKVLGHETVCIDACLTVHEAWSGEDLALAVIYEDEAVLVVNKAAGMVTHPAAGNWVGTLLNAVLHHCPDLAQLPRAGLIHRLDKETSGLLVIAKTLPATHSPGTAAAGANLRA